MGLKESSWYNKTTIIINFIIIVESWKIKYIKARNSLFAECTQLWRYVYDSLIWKRTRCFLQEARGCRRISTPQFRVSSVTVNGCQCRIVGPRESGPDSDMWPGEKQKIHVKIPRFLWSPYTERQSLRAGWNWHFDWTRQKLQYDRPTERRTTVKSQYYRVSRRQHRCDRFQW